MSRYYRLFQFLIAFWIAVFEGYFQPATIANRNNNPGNLRRWGQNPVIGGYAYFDSPRAGWDALLWQVHKNIQRGLTLYEFFAGKPGVYPGYAPAEDGNDPRNYAGFVARRTGIPVENVPISSHIDRVERQTAA